MSTVSTFEHSRCHGLTDDGNGLPFRQPPAGRDERRALADHLAEALWHGAMHLALAAGELLGLADAGAVVAAEAEALERVALRQAVPLLRDDPCRHGLCSTHAYGEDHVFIPVAQGILLKVRCLIANTRLQEQLVTCGHEEEDDEEDGCGHAARQRHLLDKKNNLSSRCNLSMKMILVGNGRIKSAMFSHCLSLEGINITPDYNYACTLTQNAWPLSYFWLIQTRLFDFELWPHSVFGCEFYEVATARSITIN